MNKLIWHTEQRKINELIPYEGNPRKMTKEQAEQLQKSLEKFNLAEIPAINTDNKIIAGHQRINILQELDKGNEIIDVRIPNRKLTDDEFREYNLRSNKNIGSWDFDELANFDVELLTDVGFSEEELNIVMGNVEPEEDDFDVDKAIEEIKEPICKRGDIWQLGNHFLMCGDATGEEDVKKLMDGKKADMVFTDPPYNVNYSSKNELLNLYGKGNNVQDEIIIDNFIDKDEYIKWIKKWFDILIKQLTDYNSIYVCGNYETLISFYDFEELKISNVLVWVKNSLVLGRMDYKCQHENILYGWVKHHKWYGPNNETTTWNINKPLSSKLHPTMKPIELCSRGINNSSKVNNIILDLFGGSGSTLIACEQLNRKCYMAEIDPIYIQVILERYIKYKGTSDDVFLLKDGEKIPYKEIFV